MVKGKATNGFEDATPDVSLTYHLPQYVDNRLVRSLDLADGTLSSQGGLQKALVRFLHPTHCTTHRIDGVGGLQLKGR